MSRVQTEKPIEEEEERKEGAKGVGRWMSHGEGVLLLGLMFPGPFQFFHSETHRDRQTAVSPLGTRTRQHAAHTHRHAGPLVHERECGDGANAAAFHCVLGG